ncbi:hypothetical protein Ddye_012423 [Dipteronia dyeriana]|uniref:Uncharacterized protein n=1 Tax=Dipteronia dyeriana TaxID=168575 RepID=A0AAD9X4K3_9ROSI|nr:hypothetical protein Ddye_012423 [Dipteronia dyeriana]
MIVALNSELTTRITELLEEKRVFITKMARMNMGKRPRRPLKPNKSIMAEFYANMISKRFLNGGSVLVQGVEVHISPDAINQYFVTPVVRVNSNSGINTIDDIDQHLERLAEVLRMNGRAEWNQMVRLYHRDLRVEAAF